MKKPKKKVKVKKTIGELIDRMYSVRQEIETISTEQIKPLMERKDKLEDIIIRRMQKDGTSSVKARKALAAIKKSTHYNVKNRAALDKYAKKNKALDLFTNAINQAAVKARMEAGIKIPGVEAFNRTSLSLTKRK